VRRDGTSNAPLSIPEEPAGDECEEEERHSEQSHRPRHDRTARGSRHGGDPAAGDKEDGESTARE